MASKLYLPQRRHIRLTQRPDKFTLNPAHTLGQGLVAAYLNSNPGTTQARDSTETFGRPGNTGTCTNMSFPPTPTSGPVWDNYLERWVWAFDGSNDYIQGPAQNIICSEPYSTVAAWIKITSTQGGSTTSIWGERSSGGTPKIGRAHV